jgi:hypothetical protein
MPPYATTAMMKIVIAPKTSRRMAKPSRGAA